MVINYVVSGLFKLGIFVIKFVLFVYSFFFYYGLVCYIISVIMWIVMFLFFFLVKFFLFDLIWNKGVKCLMVNLDR